MLDQVHWELESDQRVALRSVVLCHPVYQPTRQQVVQNAFWRIPTEGNPDDIHLVVCREQLPSEILGKHIAAPPEEGGLGDTDEDSQATLRGRKRKNQTEDRWRV